MSCEPLLDLQQYVFEHFAIEDFKNPIFDQILNNFNRKQNMYMEYVAQK